MNRLKLKKSLLSLILVSALLLSYGMAVGAEGEAEAETAAGGEVIANAEGDIDLEALAEQMEEADLISDEAALAETKLYAENDKLQLYVNENTANFAVKVKESGYIWWASPINADKDPLAKGAQIRTMRSPIYFNSGDPTVHRTTKVTIYDGAITKDGLTVEKISNGVKFIFKVEKQGTTIPLEITLEPDNSLKARIPVDEIVEDKANIKDGGSVIIDMSVLSSFGAGSVEEDGYIMVADGSGAIINFNNQKTASTLYKGQVYGRDYAIGQMRQPAKTEQVYLPVIGMVKKSETGADNAFLAVVTKGDENAILRASVAGQSSTSYNNTWFDFQMRSTDAFYMGTQNNQLSVYENGKIKTGDIEIKYFPITGNDIGVADLADTYRNYLINDQGLTKKTEANSSPYYLTMYGGTVKQQSVMGFPVNQETIATTYSQAKEITQALTEKGIDDIVAVYNDFNAAGIVGYVSSEMDYSGTLGGKKAYNDFSDYLNSIGGKLFPSMSFMEYSTSGGGYSYMMNSSKQVTNALAIQTPFELAFGTVGNSAVIFKNNWTVLSPYYFTDLFNKIEASLNKESVKNVSLGESGYLLYSDFSRENADKRAFLNRHDAATALKNGYKQLKDSGVSILSQAANAYLLPYVDMITNVPMYSSNYDVFDYDVPFYALVVHGYIPYSAKSSNSSSDAEALMEMSVLTGTPIHYEMMYESPNDFSDCEYDELFYSNYKGWVDISANKYKLFKDTITDVSDQLIVDYKLINEFERETEFANGKTVYINTATREIKVNGISISTADYGLKGEADYVK